MTLSQPATSIDLMLRDDLADFIRTKRLEKFISQEELALQSGVTVRTIWNIEGGGTEPHFKTLRKIGDALGIPYEEFLANQVAS